MSMMYGDNPDHVHSFKNLTADSRVMWALIDNLAALESMKQLRIYTYGGLWINPGWDYEGQKKGAHLIWYPLQSHLDNQTGALYMIHPKRDNPRKRLRLTPETHITLWLTRHPDPTADGAIYYSVLV